jgi:hypothetical protein
MYSNYNRSMSYESEQQPWTATSLAKAVGIAPSYIARLCRQGQIKGIKFGQAWMIPYEEGQNWLEKRTTEFSQGKEDLTEE